MISSHFSFPWPSLPCRCFKSKCPGKAGTWSLSPWKLNVKIQIHTNMHICREEQCCLNNRSGPPHTLTHGQKHKEMMMTISFCFWQCKRQRRAKILAEVCSVCVYWHQSIISLVSRRTRNICTPEEPAPCPSRFPDIQYLEQKGGRVTYRNFCTKAAHTVTFIKILVCALHSHHRCFPHTLFWGVQLIHLFTGAWDWGSLGSKPFTRPGSSFWQGHS